MSIKSYLLFFGLLWSVSGFAQDAYKSLLIPSLAYLNDQSVLVPTSSSNSLLLQGSLRENSNAVPWGMPLSILGKAPLSKGIRNHAKNYPGKRVRYEDEMKASITYQHRFAKPDVYLFIGYQHRNMRYANVTKDALNIAMFGNAMYEDKTADLSKVSFENVMYNQYSVGVGKGLGDLYVAANLSFLQGFNNQQLNNKQGYLYTAPYGEYIDARYNFTYNQSHNGASPFFAPRGLGFSGDLHVQYILNVGVLQFDAQDLGFIHWGKDAFNYANDTTLHFEGIINSNVLHLGSSISNFHIDSLLEGLVSKKTNKSYKTILPSTFSLSFTHVAKINGTDIQMSYGLQTRMLYQYYVFGYIKSSVFLPKRLLTSVSVSAGGYSLFNLGWDVGYYGKNFLITLGTHNLLGVLGTMAYPSASADLRVSYRF